MSARAWLLAAGFALSAALLGVVLWRLDWPVFLAAVRQLRFEWLGAAACFIAAGMAVRAARWKVAAGVPLVPYRAFWKAAAIGLLVNQIYPLRAGEVFRIFAIRRFARVSLGRAAASALVDRLADVLLLGASALAVVSVHSGLTHVQQLAWGALAAALAVPVFLVVFARGDRLWRRSLGAWAVRMSARLHEDIEHFYTEALATALLLRSPARVAVIILLSCACFGLDFALASCILNAFGWDLPFFAAVTLMVFLAVGTSLPAAPGYAGTYQVACILALALYGIGESQAVACSIVLQVCVLVTIIALSAWVVAGYVEAYRPASGAADRLK